MDDTDWLEISRADMKYNIDLKLQIYIHINNRLCKDSEKIGLVKIKIYCIYN